MIIYVANRKMDILTTASTQLTNGYRITDDSYLEEVDSGLTTFEFVVAFDLEQQRDAEELFAVGNYVLRKGLNDRTHCFTIIDQRTDTSTREIEIHCEDAGGVDLLNDVMPAFISVEPQRIEWYMNYWLYDSGFEIGVNEIPDMLRAIYWDSEATAAERIASTATQFDNAEVDYSFVVNGFKIEHKYLNIRKKRGKSANAIIRINREIDGIVTTTSIANLCTSLKNIHGAVPEGEDEPITLAGYSYDDGDIYVTTGGDLLSRTAMRKWSRYVNPNEPNRVPGQSGYIARSFSYDTDSKSELCNRAISELKKLREPEVNYEISLVSWDPSIEVGDYVNVVDENGQLYLQARVLSLEYSEIKQEYKATFGDYLIKQSGISDKVKALATSFSELANSRPFYTWIVYADDDQGTNISVDPDGKQYMGIARNRLSATPVLTDPTVYTWSKVQGDPGENGEDAVLLRVDSSRGNVFKNNAVSTVLTVNIIKAGETITNATRMKAVFGSSSYIQWYWKRLNDTEFHVIVNTDPMISQEGFALTLSPENVDTKVTFQCELIT